MQVFSAFLAAFVVATCLVSQSEQWVLKMDATGANFFDQWYYQQNPDQTHGFVKYVSKARGEAAGYLKNLPNNQSYIGLQNTGVVTAPRESIKMYSQQVFKRGLFITSFDHMPVGCGAWPAFWLDGEGENWPWNGEIDIVEGVHNQAFATSCLHTQPGCDYTPMAEKNFTGDWSDHKDCNVFATGNSGCQIKKNDPLLYGEGLNQNGGAVYATLWDASGISVWAWPKNSAPADVSSMAPNPPSWGMAYAHWPFGQYCNEEAMFMPQNIVIDTTLCGDWAGQPNIWTSQCPGKGGDCVAWIKNHPEELTEAYWVFDWVRVFQES